MSFFMRSKARRFPGLTTASLAAMLPGDMTGRVLDDLKKSAENGDMEAAFALGRLHSGLIDISRLGVAKNVPEAVKWLLLAGQNDFGQDGGPGGLDETTPGRLLSVIFSDEENVDDSGLDPAVKYPRPGADLRDDMNRRFKPHKLPSDETSRRRAPKESSKTSSRRPGTAVSPPGRSCPCPASRGSGQAGTSGGGRRGRSGGARRPPRAPKPPAPAFF
ncbi:MAG: hypothetical protein LBO05_07890 [Deltaproteobacteria bacterium]|nr:hypothetical protein [Deltaproteobacteria bacterium]